MSAMLAEPTQLRAVPVTAAIELRAHDAIDEIVVDFRTRVAFVPAPLIARVRDHAELLRRILQMANRKLDPHGRGRNIDRAQLKLRDPSPLAAEFHVDNGNRILILPATVLEYVLGLTA